ncbi:unnamed protein product, partial [Prunus brigantina]
MALGIGIPFEWRENGVVNHFGGAACLISLVNGDELTWSISLHRASSKSPPTFKSRSRSFTSFSTSSTSKACCSPRGCFTFVHTSLFIIGSKAKVIDKVNLPEQLSNQVVLAVYFLSELVDSKIEVFLT